MIRIVIVEDDFEFRTLTVNSLIGLEHIQVCGSYRSVEELFFGLKSIGIPDVIIMDIGLPGMNGIDAIKILKQEFPSILFIMFTVFEDAEMIFKALKIGASGYLLKTASSIKIADSIQDVYNGGSPMSSTIARLVVNSFREYQQNMEVLSKREVEILEGIRKGLTYLEVSKIHYISIHTVRSHIRAIYEKLQVHSKTEAINKVFRKK